MGFARRFEHLPRGRIARLAVVAAAAFFAGCGGGSGDNPRALLANCPEHCVISGFVGDLDWQWAPGASGSVGEGIGGGADGGGGIGAGGSLGQFRGALVVARFEDGSEIGHAFTDDEKGMVTIRPGRTYNGSILVEIHGQPGATYFDEGKNIAVPYPPGRVLRAIVPSISKNIGVTPFTEAGYQLSLRCQAGDGPVEVCATGTPQVGEGAGNAVVPARNAIRNANAHVTGVLNQQFPNTLQVDDITRLPFIVGSGTPDGTIADTPRGRYGLANIAFSKQAAMYNTAAEAPTLLATDQLSRDLQDGRLDGIGGGATAAAQRTYDPHTLTSELSAALAQQTTRYGDAATRGLLPVITAFGNTRYDSYYFDATLEPNGASSTIAVATESSSDRRAPGQKTTYAGPNAADSRGFMLYSNMGSGSLFIKTDAADSRGRVIAVGDNSNGELGDGTQTATGPAGPVVLALPGVLTHAVGGIAHTVARLADGSVYAWGDNSYGQLGQGQNGAALPRSAQPLRVALPGPAVAVAAANQSSFALLEDSSVWSWGNGFGFGTLGDNTEAGERLAPAPVLSTDGPLTGVVQLSARDNDVIALKADGSVWTWGSFPAAATTTEPSGIAAGRTVATQMEGIPATTGGVRKVLTEQGLFAVLVAGSDADGNDLDGAVYSWGVHFDITANEVLRDLIPARVLNLPPVRDLMPGGFLGYGQRPADRLTAMAIDYDGKLWKTRGRVAEQYDPANPTAQRRPQGQAPRPDCASCHVIRPKTLPPVPTSGNTCVVPTGILQLLTSQSTCESCHNAAPLSNGRALGALNCVPPTLPPPPEITRPPVRTNQCALPVGHPNIKTNAACSSCHNSIVSAPLACSPDLTPLQPPSTTTVTIAQAIDDVEPGVGSVFAGGVTNDPTPTLTGTLSAPLASGEYVTVLRNSAPIGQALSSGLDWNFAVPALAVGATHSFTARVDRNGSGSGAASAPFTLTVSTAGPAKTVNIASVTDNATPVTGTFSAAGTLFTNDTSPTLAGTIVPGLAGGESILLRRVGPSGTTVEIPVAASGGSWSFTDSNLANGASYTYSAQPVGPTGSGALGNSVTLTIDTTAPTTAPTVTLSTDAPTPLAAALRTAMTGDRLRVNGTPLGISDPTPSIRATVTGAAAGDQVEFQVSTDGQNFTSLAIARVDVPTSGNGSTVTREVPATAETSAVVGTAGNPSGNKETRYYRARLIDRAGNIGPPGAARAHEFGLFSCQALWTSGAASVTPSHNGLTVSATCGTGCHTPAPVGAVPQRQRVPSTSPSYWCTFNVGNAVLLN